MNSRRFRPVAWVFATFVPLAGLQQAVARDCNRNGIPDHCDVDCSPPGCLQYACGRSDDFINPDDDIPDECEGAPAGGMFSSTADFTDLGTLINLDDSVAGRLSRSEFPRPMPNLWVAASARWTIVRINTEPGPALGEVLGEYFTAPDGRGKNPSRTSVNLDGEVWVSNRSEGAQFSAGSITRIGVLNGGTLVPPTACEPDNRATFAPPFAYNTCVDRNGDGMITTSNGLIPLPWTYEVTDPLDFGSVDTAEDECIISYVELNAQNARHISLNKHNDVWVGGSKNNNTFDLVDGETGAILKTFDVGVGGYGGLIDCNDVLWSVGKSGNPGLFRYDTNQDITASVCCAPDMLADSNEDFEINELDQLVDNVSPGFIAYINDDDDDGDGTLDMNQSPVPYEDELVEVQLFAGCSTGSPLATWSLSWDYPTPPPDPDPIKLWLYSDKSNGSIAPGDPGYPGPAGIPIVNEAQNPWPPPTVVWLETSGTYDDAILTFAVSLDGQTTPSTSILTSGIKSLSVNLHVTMFVGTNADLDNPPFETAGCRLTKTQVASVVDDFIAENTSPGIGFVWTNRLVYALRSDCMEWMGIPFEPWISKCGVDGRKAYDFPWFFENVIDENPNTAWGQVAWLTSADNNYVRALCDVTIYFVGNLLTDSTVGPVFLNTSVGQTGNFSFHGQIKEGIVLNDTAYLNYGDGTGGGMPVKVDSMIKRKTLMHEMMCHRLPQASVNPANGGHTAPFAIPANNLCSADLCSAGGFFEQLATQCCSSAPPAPCLKSTWQSSEPHKWLFLNPIPKRYSTGLTPYINASVTNMRPGCEVP